VTPDPAAVFLLWRSRWLVELEQRQRTQPLPERAAAIATLRRQCEGVL
jgi:hypothetical protein